MRASDFYIGFIKSIRMRASNPKNEFRGLIIMTQVLRQNEIEIYIPLYKYIIYIYIKEIYILLRVLHIAYINFVT